MKQIHNDEDLAQKHLEILGELVNIGAGRAANQLNMMFSSHIELNIPSIQFYQASQFDIQKLITPQGTINWVTMEFFGAYKGIAYVAFQETETFKILKGLVDDLDSNHISDIEESALNETGNIVINAIVGSISNMINEKVDYSVPVFTKGAIKDFENVIKEQQLMMAIESETVFKLQKANASAFCFLLIPIETFENYLNTFLQ